MSQKFEEVKRVLGEKKKVVLTAIVSLLAIIAIAIGLIVSQSGNVRKSKKKVYDPELARAMSYEEFNPGDENIEGTDNVKFGAFFLRDLNGDGYAEKLKGTCKEIGKEDTLYMELNVQAAGMLKDGKIEINGRNFYLQTVLLKDDQLKENYIGNDIKEIALNDIGNGTQKLLTGIVRSGDYSYASSKTSAIGNNINNYSKNDNKIILTGTYVAEDGTETEIKKEVDLTMDWYGSTATKIEVKNQKYYDLEDRIDEENGKLSLYMDMDIIETVEELNISKNYVEGTIPQLNGYDAVEVKLLTNNADLTYDETTKIFTITRNAEVDENGNITKKIAIKNSYSVEIVYPLEAYTTMGEDTVTIEVPVKTYYEGYNNPNTEFKNPYRSAITSKAVVQSFSKSRGTTANFYVTVGKYVSVPNYRYIVSKQKPLKIYNEMSSEEKDDLYQVKWNAYTGIDGKSNGLILKETEYGKEQVSDKFIKTDASEESMENVTTNIGIAFSGANDMLEDDGWIKVYDEETDNLLVTFTKKDWDKYTSGNPYKYEFPVKHIRIETSSTKKESSLTVYNIKELNDEYITSNYAREDFDNLQYIKSSLVGYLNGNYIKTATHQAEYEAPYSVATISLSKNNISTQAAEKDEKIIISATQNSDANQVGWINGSFLVKLPDEILVAKINGLSVDNTNVVITSYELIENENGKFIKINTRNNNNNLQFYNITVNVELTPDSRIKTVSRPIELYASNEEGVDYYYSDVDRYDVNDNLNTKELVNKTSTSISLVAPNSLITSQTISNFDDKGTLVVSPEIADVKPTYAKVDNEEGTATIGVQLKNNYSNTVSDLVLLGKIPFKGNTYAIRGGDLGSTFSAKMKDTGITVPEELQGKVVVYYSENANPSKDLSDEANGWKVADDVSNWDSVKTFLIDFQDNTIDKETEYVFYYTVSIPNGLEFNKVAYSHHGVYFSLDTEEGKYRTQVESNKIGIRIAEKYNLDLTKYQAGKEKVVLGATYKVTEINEDGSFGEARTATTNANGKLVINRMYAEKVYAIEEIKTPKDYELNKDVVKIIGHVDANGALTVEKLAGKTKDNVEVVKNEGEEYKVNIKVEDEAKAKLKVVKKEQGTENLLKGVRYNVTGAGLPESGKVILTDANGEASLSGLEINEEYTILETKAEGYYLASPIKFKVVNNSGTFNIEVLEGTTKITDITEENDIPTVSLTVEDEKIPTYNLEITKIKKRTQVPEGATQAPEEITYLAGAKFKLYKEGKEIGEYTTDENGKLVINNLYQYVDGKDVDQTYVLKEVVVPDGYAKIKDIAFKVQDIEGNLQFIAEDEKEREFTSEGNTLKLILEDNPSFKLIKRDGETGELLANIKFAIYNVDNGEVPATNSRGEIKGTREIIDGREYYTYSTDANGELTLDLPEGYYKAVEIQAPDKYDIEKSVYYFGIGGSREGEKIYYPDWVQRIGGTDIEDIKSVAETSEGGYIVGGDFTSSTVQIENITLTNNGSYDGMVIKYDSEGNVEWAQGIGGSDNDYIESVAETSDGGYIVGGNFRSESITIGDITLTGLGHDGMVIKYDSEGNVEWAHAIVGIGSNEIRSVAGTSDGGCIIGGFNGNSVQLGNITLNNCGGMIIKYDKDGNVEWAQITGGTGGSYINSVAETSDGGYIVGGAFTSSTIKIGDITLTNNSSSTSSYDGMLIKYDNEGNVEWAQGIGGSDYDYIESVAETSDGGYITGGTFSSSTIQLGDITLTNNGSYDGMVIKYDSEGNVEWAQGIGGRGEEYIRSVAETSDGGCIAGGEFFSDSIQIRDTTLTSNGFYDGMVIKYDSEGNVEWVQNIGGTSYDSINEVAQTRDGNYILGGRFYSNYITIGDTAFTNKGSYDGMIVHLKPIENPGITVNQAQVIGGNSTDTLIYTAETKDGGYITGGTFSSNSIQLGDITLTNNGGSDGIIAKYDKAGGVEWAHAIGGNSSEQITAVTVTKDGGCIVGGTFSSNSIQLGDITLEINGVMNGMIIKYDAKGKVEWAQKMGGMGIKNINSISETKDGGYIVGGYFAIDSIEIGDVVLSTNNDNTFPDGMIIKYDCSGNVEWAQKIGESGFEMVYSVVGTSDGGFILVGNFDSSSMKIGDIILSSCSSSGPNIMLIKYDGRGNAEWAKAIGGAGNSVFETSDGGFLLKGSFAEVTLETGENIRLYGNGILKYDSRGNAEWVQGINGTINSLTETNDGGYIAGGSFSSSSIQIGDITLTNKGYYDGVVIKYDAEGNVEWAQAIGESDGEYINSVVETSDGGYIIGGEFDSNSIKIEDIVLENKGSHDGMIIKCDKDGKVEWAQAIGGDSNDKIDFVTQSIDGSYIVRCIFQSTSIKIGDMTLTNNGGQDVAILKVIPKMIASEVQKLEVENVRKEFKITTDIEEIDGVKGGTISGEEEKPYEVVKYGDSNTKEIKIIPDENYEIIGITVNGEEYLFEKAEDGSYTMPSFADVREDKHVVVKYALKDNKITINKVDTDTREPLAGAKFKLEQTDSGEVASELYYVEVETNSDGQAITQLPFGKYKITETQAPEGYILNEEPTIIDFIADENHEFTIENEKEAKVVVHHYIKGTTTKVAEDEPKAGKVGEKYSTAPKLELDDYELEKDENGEFIIPENATGNFTSGEIEVTYYYVEKNIPLIVHHYLEGTETPVPLADGSDAADETYSDKEGEVYTTSAISDDELDSRYELVEIPENATGTYQGEEIIVTYYYKEVERKVTLNKYQPDGTTPLEGAKFTIEEVDSSSDVDENVDDNVDSNVDNESENAEDSKVQMEFTTDSKGRIQTILNAGEYVVTEVEAPEGYQLPENPSQNITVSKASADIVINLNNDKKQGKVIVHHYVEGTTTPLPLIDGTSAEDEIKTGLVGDIYATKQLVGYELVQVPENASGEYIDGDIEVIYYYKAIPAQVVVHHYIENTTTSLSPDVVIDGVLWQNYTTTVGEDVPEYYELVAEPENKAGIMTKEPIEVIYYYKLKMYSYVVNYLEKDNEENILIPQKQGDALEYGTEVIAEDEVIEIDGYDFDSVDKDTLIIGTEENVINIYYTLKDTSVLVHHYIEGTTTSLSDDVVIEGKVFETYETEVATDIPSKYELVAVPENAQGEMTEEQIVVTYYYRTKPTQVIVHHYEEGTTNKLSETVTIDGRIDDEYTTTAATDIPVKYELVAEPENASGIMTEEPIEVTYYYGVKDASLVIKYVEKDTELEIAQSESQTGKVDEDYITGPKEIENYTLVGDSENTTGKLTVEPITVIFYYLQNTKVTVQYIDKATDEILEEVTEPGLVGDSYTATSKDFENYVLVERPAKETVTMGKEEIVLKYYYAKVSGGVIEKHIDVVTGDILANEVHAGNEGDSYDIPSKIFEGYDLVENKLPANAKGTMKVDTIEVTYYYHYRSRVVAEYIDKATGEKLVLDEVFDGHEGDDYTTEGKQIDDYRLIEVPKNANGTMTKAPIKVTYYYVHLTGGVIERHIDIMTGEQLVVEEKFDGYEGDPYTTEPENIPYYDLVEDKYPANAEGTMTVEQIIVNYYYVRQTEVNVKYVDKVTGKEIEKTEIISGHEGDNYTTESKDITGFDLIEIPENKDGKMTKEAIEVTYYYARPAKVVVNHIDIETNQNLAEEEVITGHQDDTYTTISKDIQYYTLTKTPANAEGKMIVNVVTEAGTEVVNDTTYVNYYYRKMEFNLKVDKTIGSVIVNGVEKQVNGNLGKVEIYRKELATTKVQVVYNIVVTNNSELSGKAKLLENIPDGMTMKKEKNALWNISQTVAELETEDLKPGESKTYKVVLDWLGGENNTGTKKNMVQITGTENDAGYEEKDKKDNTDTADLIVTVGTGEYTFVAGVGITIIALAAIAVTVVARKRKE